VGEVEVAARPAQLRADERDAHVSAERGAREVGLAAGGDREHVREDGPEIALPDERIGRREVDRDRLAHARLRRRLEVAARDDASVGEEAAVHADRREDDRYRARCEEGGPQIAVAEDDAPAGREVGGGDRERDGGVLDHLSALRPGGDEREQPRVAEQVVVAGDEPRDEPPGMVREQAPVEVQPHPQEALSRVGPRMEGPERGVQRADARPDEEVGRDAPARERVDDADLERPEIRAAPEDDRQASGPGRERLHRPITFLRRPPDGTAACAVPSASSRCA